MASFRRQGQRAGTPAGEGTIALWPSGCQSRRAGGSGEVVARLGGKPDI
ncbi:MAG TPA: hypothetical protein VFA18_01765 [Gemmataceae bacterium]|nr:hypothetical protein [Gemmataceae bacterium]